MRDGARRHSKQEFPPLSFPREGMDLESQEGTFRPEPPSPSGKAPSKLRRPGGGDAPPTWTWLPEELAPIPFEEPERAPSASSRDDPASPLRPKKLWTHDFAVIRTSTREGFNRIAEQPFQQRPFCGQEELQDWTPVNSGQLLGFISQKGGQLQVPNQDEYAVLHEAGYQIYLVVDGLGMEGEAAAKYVRRWLVKALTDLVRERDGRVLANGELMGVFAELQKSIVRAEAEGSKTLGFTDMKGSGCTAAVALLTPARSLRGVWLGDCQCLAGKRDRPDESYVLTPPHLTGGTPQMATRATGCLAHDYLLREAEEFIEADIDHAGIDFLILGTGGLWRGIDKACAVSEVSKAGPYYAQHACTRLTMSSQENQMRSAEAFDGPLSVQDTTAIVAWIGNVCDDSGQSCSKKV